MKVCGGRRGQLYVFRGSRTGVAVRLRNATGWRHVSFEGKVKGPSPEGRGLLTVEAVTWRSRGDTRKRLGTKAFVRFKVGLGGG